MRQMFWLLALALFVGCASDIPHMAPIAPTSAPLTGATPAQNISFVKHKPKIISDDQIDSNIDAGLSVSDHIIIKQFMLTLPTDQRENAVYLDLGGTLRSNHISNLKSVETITLDKNLLAHPANRAAFAWHEFGDKYGDSVRHVFEVGTPPANGGTGPYRRYYGQNGYDAALGNLYLANCQSANLLGRDAGYEYIESYGNDYLDTGGNLTATDLS